MITFQKITNSSDPFFTNLYELYQLAFPETERRNRNELEQILDHNKQFEADALMKNGNFCGFFTFWNFNTFHYVEHFAISPDLRGQNAGSETMQTFMLSHKTPIVLEVEVPDTPEAVRRIKFYERLGLHVINQEYAQPYYDRSGNLLPMLIMSNDPHFANEHFNQIKNTLYKEVYDYNPDNI